MTQDPLAVYLADLDGRVGALEDRVGALASAESLQPNYLTIDPVTGLVGANFTGHLSAQGVDLQAGTDTTPPSSDRIRWLRQSDGAVVADLSSFDSVGSAPALNIRTYTNAGDTAGGAIQIAANSNGVVNPLLSLSSDNTLGGSSVVIQAGPGGTQRTLITGSQLSSFLQLTSAQNLKVQAGASVVALPVSALASATVTLPITWGTQHLAFIAQAWPVTTFTSFWVLGTQPSSLSQGTVAFNNNNTAQNATVYWVSFGH